MSLVVCSNQADDAGTSADSSIFEPWSFRNGLSSTYTIPKDAQVGLHSCKVNLNGTATLSGNEALYQYFGELLDSGGSATSTDSISFSTAQPILTPLNNGQVPGAGRLRNYDAAGIAQLLEDRMNDWVFHPNLRDKVDAFVEIDASTKVFDGYNIQYGQYNDEATSTIPDVASTWSNNPEDTGDEQGDGFLTNRWDYPGGVLRADYPKGDDPPDKLNWSYAAGTFAGVKHGTEEEVQMVATELPLSLYNGKMIIDIQNINTTQDLDWSIGLSRFNDVDDFGEYAPYWYDADRGDDAITGQFFDYSVRRYQGKLYLQQTVMNSDVNFDIGTDKEDLYIQDLEYWNQQGNSLTEIYDISTNSLTIHKIQFQLKGQQMKIDMIDDRGVLKNIYTYISTEPKARQLKPINQACWNLHPVLSLQTTAAKFTGSMTIETYHGCKDIKNYSVVSGTVYEVKGVPRPTPLYNQNGTNETSLLKLGGWFEWINLSGLWEDCKELETRYWQDMGDTTSGPNGNGQATYAGIPSSGNNRRIGYKNNANEITTGFQNVLILSPSELYANTQEANVQRILGFTQGTVDVFSVVGAGPTDVGINFKSDGQAKLTSSQSIFVRLDNFTQITTNAFKGNSSAIIAHLPRFDGQAETGRLYYQPSEIAWIDLNNAYEQKISSFDLSFCYVNEQFVEALTGQSIVVLMFREKPKSGGMSM